MDKYPVSISLEEAVEWMMVHSGQTGTETIKTKDAGFRVLAEDIIADEDIPPFDRSPYDGYAVRSADAGNASWDNPVELQIIEEIPAGKFPEKVIYEGTASKILTGAPIPEGADAVIPYEKTIFDAHTVKICVSASPGKNIARKGEDIAKGSVVVKKGTLVNASVMAQMASLGYDEVKVYKKLNIGVLCTGSELVGIGEKLCPGQIRNSNGYMVGCSILENHMQPMDLGMCADDASVIAGKLRENIENCDCFVTTGGASVGDYDVMKEAIELAGGQILFWKMRMKPGAAAVGGVIDGKPVFALSGNPGAAAVALHMLALPVMRKMSGLSHFYPLRIQVKLLNDFHKKNPTRRFLRGRMVIKNGEAYFVTLPKQENGMTTAMRECSLFGEIPAGVEEVPEGTIIFAYDLEHFR